MAALQFVHAFTEALAEKKHNLGSDTLKILLTNDTPDVAADAVKADLTSELGTGGGYTAGMEAKQARMRQDNEILRLLLVA